MVVLISLAPNSFTIVVTTGWWRIMAHGFSIPKVKSGLISKMRLMSSYACCEPGRGCISAERGSGGARRACSVHTFRSSLASFAASDLPSGCSFVRPCVDCARDE